VRILPLLVLVGCNTPQDERVAVDVLAFERVHVRHLAERLPIADLEMEPTWVYVSLWGVPGTNLRPAMPTLSDEERALLRADLRVRVWLRAAVVRGVSLEDLAAQLRAVPGMRDSIYLVSRRLPIDLTRLADQTIGPIEPVLGSPKRCAPGCGMCPTRLEA
jgi:hypothetical protein